MSMIARAAAIDALNPLIRGLAEAFVDSLQDILKERKLIIVSSDTCTQNKEVRYYSRKEVAKLLHVSIGTIARMTKDGSLKPKRVGSRVLFDADAIDAAVRQGEIYKYKRKK